MRILSFKKTLFILYVGLFIFSLPSVSFCEEKETKNFWIDAHNVKPRIKITLPSFAPVIEKLGGGVVNVMIEGVEGPSPNFMIRRRSKDEFNDFPFDYFLQIPEGDKENKKTFTSLGSGFVINEAGFIITNNHVVKNATKITVTFKGDKRRFNAKLIGGDEKTDIALLKVDIPKEIKLTPVVLGDSDKIRAGDWVIAIGNPFKLDHTATVGIVSAKSRKSVGGPYTDLIQTDASINPGNSGGPLFNASGEVIGINTAIFSRNNMGSNIGIGFAIPINIAKSIIRELKIKGKVTRGWLGVLIQPITSDTAKALGLKKARGALVGDIIKGSPAFKAKIKRGDVIIKYGEQEVVENNDLPVMVGKTKVGEDVIITIIRDKKEIKLPVKIAELKEKTKVIKNYTSTTVSKLGLSVQNITQGIAKGLNLKQIEGVVVSSIKKDSISDRAGLQRGDIILEVDSKKTNSIKEFEEATKELKSDKPLLLLVSRGGHTLFFTLKIKQ